MAGEFVISLDFELLWGVRDHATRDSYGANVLGGREAIPRILDLFERNTIAATWATVGMLMAESREELLASLPPEALRPRYADPNLSSYSYLDEVGEDERRDPHYFGMSLVRQIMACPKQEIGTHTHSNYYPLERGQNLDNFEADLNAAIAIAKRRGITPRSIVFPRNQYDASYLKVCEDAGLSGYRGNETHWAYHATPRAGRTFGRRGVRLMDAYSGLLGAKTFSHNETGAQGRKISNVRASQFLRPKAGVLRVLHPLHVRTIKRAMTKAAQTDQGYHLWWHPHNFGLHTDDNIAVLDDILTHFHRLAADYGMVSTSLEPPHH